MKIMKHKKKLDLKELELQLPSIESNETKIIIGGNDYADEYPNTGKAIDTSVAWDYLNNGGGSDYNDPGDYDHFYDQDYDDGGGNLGNGGGPGQDGDHNNQGEEYKIDNLPAVDHQTSKECWMEAAEFLYKFFDKSYNDTEIENYDQSLLKAVAQMTGGGLYDAYHNGLNNSYLEEFVNNFFEATKITQDKIIDSLQNGCPVYAAADAVFNNDNAWDHVVIIIGYEYSVADKCFYFLCADSGTGTINRYEPSDINMDYIYSITGLK